MTEVLEGELVVVAKESGLEPTKVEGLLLKFSEPFNHARQAIDMAKDITVTSESQVDEMESARVARLELKNIRVDVEKTRKELKEQSLREGKAIDGMANIIKAMIVPVEEHLEAQEKFAERLAEERKKRKIAERITKLSAYVTDVSMYKFEDLGDEAFERLVTEVKAAKEVADVAARKAREAEIAEQQRAKEERAAKERAVAREAERLRKKNAELKVKADAERKAREKLEAEKRAKEEAEAKTKAEAEAAERQKLLAPDKEKLIAFADELDKLQLPLVENREARELLDETKDFLVRIGKNLRQKAEEL